MITSWQPIQKIQTPRQNHIRQRTSICLQGFKELLWLLRIKSALSTPYHSQTDGTTKQINQKIKTYLAIYCSSHPETWMKSLTTLEFTHNNRWHADWLKTPFELMFGSLPSCNSNFIWTHQIPNNQRKAKTLTSWQTRGFCSTWICPTMNHWMINRRKDTFNPFKKGNMVWLDTRNIKINYHSKMEPKAKNHLKLRKTSHI